MVLARQSLPRRLELGVRTPIGTRRSKIRTLGRAQLGVPAQFFCAMRDESTFQYLEKAKRNQRINGLGHTSYGHR